MLSTTKHFPADIAKHSFYACLLQQEAGDEAREGCLQEGLCLEKTGICMEHGGRIYQLIGYSAQAIGLACTCSWSRSR